MVREAYLAVDAIAQKDNIFTRMDARLKVVVTGVMLASVIGLPGTRLQLGLFTVALLSMLAVKIPFRLIFCRILPPLALGTVVFCFMVFFHEGNRLFVLNVAGWEIVGYREGFNLGLTVLARITGSVALLMFLSFTTPIHQLGYALIWLRVPKVIVEILLLTYRYLFVLWDEGMRIRQAQTLRLGYPAWRSISGWKQALRSTATLMGMVFIRAYDRAESTFSAMQVRAYNGNITGYDFQSWNKLQTKYLISSFVVLFILVAVSI